MGSSRRFSSEASRDYIIISFLCRFWELACRLGLKFQAFGILRVRTFGGLEVELGFMRFLLALHGLSKSLTGFGVYGDCTRS